MEQSELQLLTIAALLHDIGKFAQRAGAPKSAEMEGEYCPSAEKGRPTHLHVLYGDYFIEQVLPLPPELETQRSRLARLASAHHKPASDSRLERALSTGDRLSAGLDRKGGEEGEGDYKSARLLSVFDQVSFKGAKSPAVLNAGRYYRLKPIDEEPFPVPLADARKTGYEELHQAFVEEVKTIETGMGVRHYIGSLTALLEKYTWCIPSSTYHSLPDISLYDHALTTAALAQAAAAYHEEAGGMPGEGAEGTVKFILVGGELSGIQKYIFSLDKSHGAGVAKLFRARSFYLQALTKSVVLSLLERAGLLPVARIMDAGGRFVLLLPATAAVRGLLPEFEMEVQRWFFETFRGVLTLSLSYDVELAESDLELTRFQVKLDALNDSLERCKLGRFDRLMRAGMNPVIDLDYQDYAVGGGCRVCQINPVDAEAQRQYRTDFRREAPICRTCFDQIDLIGTRLPTSDYMIIGQGTRGGAVALFGGLYLRLVKEVGGDDRDAVEIAALKERGRFAHHAVAGHLPMIEKKDLLRWQEQELLETGADGGNTFEGDEVRAGWPKTFQILAGESRRLVDRGGGRKELLGKSFIGALKADVDNLGLLFSIGLNERLSISRFTGLSRMLNHFFADHLVRRIEAEYPNMYVVFAGGDDLFLLGPWTEVVAFANVVGEEFRRFVAGNPEITLSAGIAVTKPGLPVHAIAEQAEELLEQSKGFRKGSSVKNAVTLFGTTAEWEAFGTLLTKGEWLYDLLRLGKVPMGLGGRLLYYGNERRAFVGGDIKRGIYLSHMQYDFTRNISEKSVPDRVERERILGIQQDDFFLEHMRLPVSYALYRLRKD